MALTRAIAGAFVCLLVREVIAGPPHAAADEPSADVLMQANTLFADGKRLLEQGATLDACSAFAESQRLVPRGGTLLNLALCREREGKLPEAWRLMHEALTRAQTDQRDDRVAIALEHIAAVDLRLSWITLVVPQGIDPDRLTLHIDDAPVRREDWNAVPIAAGDHMITAEYPRSRRWVSHLSVGTAAAPRRQLLIVGPLTPDTQTPAVAPVVTAPARAPGERDARKRRLRVLRLTSLGIGLAGVALGAVSGGLAIARKREVDAHCEDGLCDEAGMQAVRQGHRLVRTSTAATLSGAAALTTWMVLPGGLLGVGERAATVQLVRHF